MVNFLERTLEVDLSRRYREIRIATLEQFKKEAVILGGDATSLTFLVKKEGKVFLGYADGIKEMELIPLDDSIISALINTYGKR